MLTCTQPVSIRCAARSPLPMMGGYARRRLLRRGKSRRAREYRGLLVGVADSLASYGTSGMVGDAIPAGLSLLAFGEVVKGRPGHGTERARAHGEGGVTWPSRRNSSATAC